MPILCADALHWDFANSVRWWAGTGPGGRVLLAGPPALPVSALHQGRGWAAGCPQAPGESLLNECVSVHRPSSGEFNTREPQGPANDFVRVPLALS